MSVQAMTWVFESSSAKGGGRLVLLALANHAGTDGSNAYPAIETLAREARMSRSGVQKALRKLEAEGHIRMVGRTPKGTVVYHVEMGPTTDAPGPTSGSQGGLPRAEKGPTSSARTNYEPTTEPEQSAPATDDALESRVHSILAGIAARRRCKLPDPEAIRKVMEAYPDKDAARVANELEFWAVHGSGSDRQIKNLASTFRNFMRIAEPASAPAAANGGASRYDRIEN